MDKTDNLKPFQKGKSGNPNGRPRKLFRTINDELQAKGIEKLSKSDLIDAYGIIFNATEKELTSLSEDKKTPYAMRLIIMELKNKRTRSSALKDYRDYMFGKAKSSSDVTIMSEQPLFGKDTK